MAMALPTRDQALIRTRCAMRIVSSGGAHMIRRLRTVLALVLLLATSLLAAQNTPPLDVQLKEALQKADIEGDTRGAIRELLRIAETKGADRALAASALLHAARLYEQLKDPQAQTVYEMVVNRYGDRKEAVSKAKDGLARLRAPRLDARLICEDCQTSEKFDWISEDGRLTAVKSEDEKGIEVRDLKTGQVTPLLPGGDNCQ